MKILSALSLICLVLTRVSFAANVAVGDFLSNYVVASHDNSYVYIYSPTVDAAHNSVSGPGLFKCRINVDDAHQNTFNPDSCSDPTKGQLILSDTNDKNDIIFDNDNKRVYITQQGPNQIYMCRVLDNGDFTHCQAMRNSFEFNHPDNIKLDLVDKFAFLVSANEGYGIDVCKIDRQGEFVDCHDSGSQINSLNDMVLYRYGNDEYAFIASAASVIKCDVDKTTGGLSACTPVMSQPVTSSGYTAVAMDAQRRQLYAYQLDPQWDHQITQCTIDASAGIKSNTCSTYSGSIPYFPPVMNIDINRSKGLESKVKFLASLRAGVIICDINYSLTQPLSDCQFTFTTLTSGGVIPSQR